MRVYFASPFFNEEQVEREESLKSLLRKEGFDVFSPKEACHLQSDAPFEDQLKVFSENIESIQDSHFVFAVTDGKDMGTIWEAGYAFGLGIPVVYFAETVRGKFNLMLALSAKGVITSRRDIKKRTLLKMITQDADEPAWKGTIE